MSSDPRPVSITKKLGPIRPDPTRSYELVYLFILTERSYVMTHDINERPIFFSVLVNQLLMTKSFKKTRPIKNIIATH